jgi:hypothetical protein
MLNNVLDHSEGVEIPGQKPNIPGHMVADAASPNAEKCGIPFISTILT